MSTADMTALVTGAAGAIGSAVTNALLHDCARVIAVDVDEAGLVALKNRHPNVIPMSADFSSISNVESLASEVVKQFGCVDILVNNAGVLSNNKIIDTRNEEWNQVHAVNVDAAFALIRTLVSPMRRQQWGRIVNLASFAAKSGGLTSGTAYSVSKAAMIGLTFSVARETAAEGVTVNAIAPAYVMSQMIETQLTAEQREKQLTSIPVGRFCEPVEVAHTVRFLASPLAGFITGEVIDMNGGLQFD
ncbi:MAG: SDR family oxidoreductase [Hyphomicrobiaceae bacterium]|nr:SDR family oxidoreductase [Hyphomicrobiaceae bacterium]